MTILEKGDWDIIKNSVQRRWTRLTDNDLAYVEGQQNELLNRIQKRTGKSLETVEAVIAEYRIALVA